VNADPISSGAGDYQAGRVESRDAMRGRRKADHQHGGALTWNAIFASGGGATGILQGTVPGNWRARRFRCGHRQGDGSPYIEPFFTTKG